MQNNIKKIRLEKSLTLEQVAEKAGTTAQQVHKLENAARKLSTEWMGRLSQALGCSPVALISDEAETTFFVPVIETVPQEGFEDSLTVPIAGQFPYNHASNTLFATVIYDEAMSMAIAPGSLIVVDYSQKDLSKLNEKIVLVSLQDKGILLRKFRDHPARLEPFSNQPFDTIYLDTMQYKVIGRVLSAHRDL